MGIGIQELCPVWYFWLPAFVCPQAINDTNASCLQFYSVVFPLLLSERIKIGLHPFGDDVDRPNPVLGDSLGCRSQTVTQRDSQRGSGEQLIDTKSRSDLIHICNPLLSPRQKSVALPLFTLTRTLQAAFSFQRHSPISEYVVSGGALGVWRGFGQRQRHDFPLLHCPGMDYIRMTQAPHACREEPALPLLSQVRKDIGNEA